MEKLDLIKDYANTLKLNYLNANASKIVENADFKDLSYQDFLLDILKNEISLKDMKAQERLLKNAGFPMIKNIEDFDFNFQRSITSKQMNRLIELEWIDRMFNL
ncbi:ATP-binding protein, partial [Hafnia paralvei]|uniref:ATP-binding protein n=1 Tax=Hafnia paralvei TaxID=546367 RepID=UPI000DFDE473